MLKQLAIVFVVFVITTHAAHAQTIRPLSDDPVPKSSEEKYELGLGYAEGGDKPHNDAVAARWMRLALQDTAFLGPKQTVRMCQHDDVYEVKPWGDLSESETESAFLLQLSEAYALGKTHGYPFARDDTKSLTRLREAAEVGNPIAQHWLFQRLFYDQEKVSDTESALDWARKSSAQGDYAATFQLATVYEDGFRVEADSTEALKLYEITHKQELKNLDCWRQRFDAGDRSAGLQVGLIYYNEIGVRADKMEAVRYFEAAANAGVAPAQTLLADILLGVPGHAYSYAVQDPYAGLSSKVRCQRAVGLYRQAAAQGDRYAKAKLADLIGRCVSGSKHEIFELRLGAAEETSRSDQQFMVAMAYAQGEGTPLNKVQAGKWYLIITQIHISFGSFAQMAADKWHELEPEMTPDERQQAQTEAREWLSTHPFLNYTGNHSYRSIECDEGLI